MKNCFIFFLFMSLQLVLTAQVELKPVLTIGGDTGADSFFYKIDSAVMAPDKSIFILDSKAQSISKFSFDGTFIKRVGKKGKGPGAVLSPSHLRILGDKLYIVDFNNLRIWETNVKLDTNDYISLKTKGESKLGFVNPHSFRVIDHNTFMGCRNLYEKDKSRIYFFHRNGELKSFPYNYMPGKGKIHPDSLKAAFFSLPVIGVNKQTQRILATAQTLNNEIDFFLYDFSGKEIIHFTYKQDKKFQFPADYINASSKEDDDLVFNLSSAELIQPYKKYFMVFMTKIENFSEKCIDPDRECECLVFSMDGKCVSKFSLGDRFTPYFVSESGYILGQRKTVDDDETETLSVFKLNLK